LVTDLPLVISGWLKVDRRSGTRIIDQKIDDGIKNCLADTDKRVKIVQNETQAISRQYRYLPAVYPVLLPAAGTLSMSIKENYRSTIDWSPIYR